MAAKPFAEPITLPASVAGAAPIQIPHGTAPSAPVNGDLWTTSAGLYARINGVTVGPFSTGGGGPTMSDTAPGSPTAGQLWFDTATFALSIYYDSQWVETGQGGAGSTGGSGLTVVDVPNMWFYAL